MATPTAELEQLAINTIRTLAMDAVQKANSGHPGLPMGAAPMAYTLWQRHLRHNPNNPNWHNRDRFVLSAGHGSMLIYALLHLTGYDLSLDEIKNFRQWGSKTPGHPEVHETPGVETTTGPLGQGAATAVGFALAEAYLASVFNTEAHQIVDHYTFALVSDGDLMEGVSIEATALAGHWGLGKLIFLYDDNSITLDGSTDMTFTEDIPARFAAQGWHTVTVADGNDVETIDAAINAAKAVTDQPSLISIKTIIGYGSPNYAGTSTAHGKALGEEEIRLTKANLGWPSQEAFYIPEESLAHFREAIAKGAEAEAAWRAIHEAWKAAHPDLAATYETAFAGALPAGWDADLPTFDEGSVATRNAIGAAINAIAPKVVTMIGGDADLAGSTKTLISGAGNTGRGVPTERNLRFGVREHGMGAIVNGLALHGGIIKPYSATFLTFSDYMRGAIRLGSLMNVPAVYVFTHDSIGLGEDGPTHQPVEHVMSLRAIPNLHVFRPGDANEMIGAWKAIMTLAHPAVVIGSRQNLAVLSGENVEGIHEGVARGAYIVAESDGMHRNEPEVILMATGSELEIAIEAFSALDDEGVKTRVVSMPCWELFDAQDDGYKEAVLPYKVTNRVSIEAGTTLGWQKYVGFEGISIGVDTFGASAPYEVIYENYGLTARDVLEAVSDLLDE